MTLEDVTKRKPQMSAEQAAAATSKAQRQRRSDGATRRGSGRMALGRPVHFMADQVDNDPVAYVHGQALLIDDATTTVVFADIRQPDELLAMPEITGLLDLAASPDRAGRPKAGPLHSFCGAK